MSLVDVDGIRIIDTIIVHCSDSPWANAKIIQDWHVQGNGWDDIGYHEVINNGYPWNTSQYQKAWDGYVQHGRPLQVEGAHARGHNATSIGICLIGKPDGNGVATFSPRQSFVLRMMIDYYRYVFDIDAENVIGHRDVQEGKTCPGFDVQSWYKRLA